MNFKDPTEKISIELTRSEWRKVALSVAGAAAIAQRGARKIRWYKPAEAAEQERYADSVLNIGERVLKAIL